MLTFGNRVEVRDSSGNFVSGGTQALRYLGGGVSVVFNNTTKETEITIPGGGVAIGTQNRVAFYNSATGQLATGNDGLKFFDTNERTEIRFPVVETSSVAIGSNFTIAPVTNCVKLSAASPVTSNGTTAIQSGQRDGELLYIVNEGANSITFQHGANVLLPNATDYTLGADASLTLKWSSSASSWQTTSVSEPVGAASPINIQDEGSAVGAFSTLNFVGAAVNVIENPVGIAEITISAAVPTGTANRSAFFDNAGNLDDSGNNKYDDANAHLLLGITGTPTYLNFVSGLISLSTNTPTYDNVRSVLDMGVSSSNSLDTVNSCIFLQGTHTVDNSTNSMFGGTSTCSSVNYGIVLGIGNTVSTSLDNCVFLGNSATVDSATRCFLAIESSSVITGNVTKCLVLGNDFGSVTSSIRSIFAGSSHTANGGDANLVVGADNDLTAALCNNNIIGGNGQDFINNASINNMVVGILNDIDGSNANMVCGSQNVLTTSPNNSVAGQLNAITTSQRCVVAGLSNVITSSDNSCVVGEGLNAVSSSQPTARFGQFNIDNTSHMFQVGHGANSGSRATSIAVDTSGYFYVNERIALNNGFVAPQTMIHAVTGALSGNIGTNVILLGDFTTTNTLQDSSFVGGGAFGLNATNTAALSGGFREAFIFGSGCIVTGGNSAAFGLSNQNSGASCFVCGTNNIVQATGCFVSGENNDVTNSAHDYCFIGGEGHETTRSHQALVGEFSDPQSDEIFAVGNGASLGAKNNAFAVREDGEAQVDLGLSINEANGRMGVATLVAGTVTVANTEVKANSRIFLTIQTPGGTLGVTHISARNAGVDFTITSTSGTDTSTVAWMIVDPL